MYLRQMYQKILDGCTLLYNSPVLISKRSFFQLVNATLLVPTVQSVMSLAVNASANLMSLGVNVTSVHLAHTGLDPMDVSVS